MPNKLRKANATAAAESYAPRPKGSAVTYGFVAAALLLVAAFIIGAFFHTDITANPIPLLGLATLAFVGGVTLRLWRGRENVKAIDKEYAKREPLSSGPATADAASSEWVTENVTFSSAFLLPGLDRPHPPGTFEVRVRREPLDVSWAAFLETRTIMLTGDGTLEALDVKADDLTEALSLDRRNSGLQLT